MLERDYKEENRRAKKLRWKNYRIDVWEYIEWSVAAPHENDLIESIMKDRQFNQEVIDIVLGN